MRNQHELPSGTTEDGARGPESRDNLIWDEDQGAYSCGRYISEFEVDLVADGMDEMRRYEEELYGPVHDPEPKGEEHDEEFDERDILEGVDRPIFEEGPYRIAGLMDALARTGWATYHIDSD